MSVLLWIMDQSPMMWLLCRETKRLVLLKTSNTQNNHSPMQKVVLSCSTSFIRGTNHRLSVFFFIEYNYNSSHIFRKQFCKIWCAVTCVISNIWIHANLNSYLNCRFMYERWQDTSKFLFWYYSDDTIFSILIL